MLFSKKLIAGCVLSLLGCVNLHALQIKVFQVDPKKQNATVYLRWTVDDYTNSDARYTVQRSLNDGNWETLATDLERLEYFDQSVKPGEKYKYKVTSTTNGSAETDNLTIPNRNHSHPVYSLNVEYEISFDELLHNGWKGQGFHVTPNNPGKEYNDVSWNAKQPDSNDSYYYRFLPKSKTLEDTKGTEELAGYSPDNFYLDGNRYLWINNGKRSTGQQYYCEIPNFRVNGDKAISAANIAKTTEAAERYPWAGVGYSWRAIMAGASANNRMEKCWYITVRENNKYGVLCVWGPDQIGHRPYQGHPFYLDWEKFRADYEKDGNGNTIIFNDPYWGTSKPNVGNQTNSLDDTYSIAFSDHGRSYIRRTGSGDYTQKAVTFASHTNHVMGRRHDWKPNRSNDCSKYLMLGSVSGQPLPGGRSDLLNVKGNIGAANWKDASDATQKQNYGWICQITNYNNANHQVVVRADKVNSDRVTCLASRLRIQGFDKLYSDGGYKGTQNYVIPMSGTNCDDMFAQLSNSSRAPSEDYPHLLYLYSDLVNGSKASVKGSDKTPNDVTSTDRNIFDNHPDIQRIDLGIQYNHIVGGCTFDFKGEKFLILPATRQGDYNMGDFTIFRIDNRNGNSNVTLTPVINYTSPAIQNKQWSSTAGKGANPNRTFIRTFLKSENRAGFDNEDQYVEIYVYLPGRTINMYTFYGTYVPDGAPKVEMLPNIVTNEDYLNNQNYQYLLHYDVVTGEVMARHSDNTTAPHLKEFYTRIDWNVYRGDKFNNSTARDTKVLLSELQSTNYLQRTDGNWDTYTPYQSRTDTGSADYWNLTNHLGGQYGTSIWTRPQYKRNVAGKTQVLYGNNNESNSRYYYSPKPVKNLSVKAYHNGSGNDINNATTYRVDINFDAPDEVWGHNENSHNRPNGGSAKIPVTRYEIWAEGQGGLTTKANNKIAYVMTGNTAYPNYVKGEVYHKGNFYAVQAKDQTIKSGNYSNTAVVIPGNYDFNNKNNTMYAAVPGNKDDGKEKCVVSIISTNPSICNDTYRVRAVYGTDNWNGPVTEYAEYGVSKYADASAVPATASYTGVDDIVSDNVTDGEDVYYTLQGIRLEGQPTAPGIYLRHNSAGTSKVYFH